MSNDDGSGSSGGSLGRFRNYLEDDERNRRRDILFLLLFLLLLLIPAFLCGSTVASRLRRGVPGEGISEPLATVNVTVDAAGSSSNSTDDQGGNRVCGDGVCDAGEQCAEDCSGGGSDPEGGGESDLPAEGDPCPFGSCLTEVEFPGGGGAGPGCGFQCEMDEDCYYDAYPLEKRTSCHDGLCWDANLCPSCGQPCQSSNECNGLACTAGFCWDTIVCLPPAVGASPSPSDPCAEHGGLQWQGDVCICAGLVDQVTICQDGIKFDNVTDVACTPDPAACQLQSGGNGGGGSVCGNGIVEAGETCDGSGDPCSTNTCIQSVCQCLPG